MSSVGGVGGGISVGDMKNLDLESAMMLVQTRRAELLESQLVGRISDLDAKNQKIAALNQMLSAVKHNRPTDPDASKDAGKATFGPQPADPAKTRAIFAAMRDAGVEGVPADSTAGDKISQKDYDTLVSKLTSAVEGLNSTQQMDMLKVQSLSNKRNEAFDVMTNFIKKMQDNRSSIIGNMR